jgi:heme-degrading monooxygenase HmoA
MLVRIVKMHFSSSFITEFKLLFNDIKPFIANFKGCNSVQLLQHETDENVFFTISKWQTAQDLENYRQSELFLKTWAKVKPNFISKAEAWSLLEQ